MNASDFMPGGIKPLYTKLTSGTGTFVPSVDNALCKVRVTPGGAGGWSASGNSGGGGGATVEFWVRVPIAGLPYVVGAAGAVSANGSPSSFGPITANPGRTPSAGAVVGMGGIIGMLYGSVNANSVTVSGPGSLSGVNGGHGGTGSINGGQIGFPFGADVSGNYSVTPMSAQEPNSNNGFSCGGDSFYGKGGTNGNAPAATAYGAGGGAGAAGRGGVIEIEDFGA